MRVLILWASAGDGHLSAARALHIAFTQHGAEARTVDALDCAPRLFRLWFCGGYEGLVRHNRRLWGRLYRWSDRPSFAYALQTWMDDVFLARLDGLISDEQPDWIVCTQALPLPRLARNARTGRQYGVGVVITDIHPHAMWLRGDADIYFVPAEQTRAIMESRRPGIARRTVVTGIPVHSAFESCGVRSQSGRRSQSVMLAAGGIGAGPLVVALDALMAVRSCVNLTVVCGRNAAAFEACSRRRETVYGPERERMTVLGYVSQESYASCLADADLLVGKPGGLTMAECLAVGTPMVVYEPLLIPGQEEGNARFLAEAECGVMARDPAQLTSAVEDLLGSPERLARMRDRARRTGRPYAARTVVEHVMADM